MKLFYETIEHGVKVHRLTQAGINLQLWQFAAIEALNNGFNFSYLDTKKAAL